MKRQFLSFHFIMILNNHSLTKNNQTYPHTSLAMISVVVSPIRRINKKIFKKSQWGHSYTKSHPQDRKRPMTYQGAKVSLSINSALDRNIDSNPARTPLEKRKTPRNGRWQDRRLNTRGILGRGRCLCGWMSMFWARTWGKPLGG